LVGSGEFELSFLTPLGRRGEVYKVGGELVSLYLLSGILNSIVDTYRLKAQHENFQAYLFAADDQRLGKVIHLYVESLDFLELPKTETERLLKIGAEIKSAFDSRVRPFEKIREIKTVGTVEKSAIGKINKNQLSELQISMR
jgi:acyl-CoA synthetase (AMP-forming)/AMP-acid ligase II